MGNTDEIKRAIKEINKSFKKATLNPEIYLSVQTDKASLIKNCVKSIYDLSTINGQTNAASEILQELVLEGMDEEQIWQQIEIRNSVTKTDLVKTIGNLLSLKNEQFLVKKSSEDKEDAEDFFSSSEVENSEGDAEIAEDFDDSEDDSEDKLEMLEAVIKNKKKKYKSSIVDDKFFKLREMEEFLKQEDDKEMKQKNGKLKSINADIDYFQEYFGSDQDDDESDDESEEENGKNPKYNDFFDDEAEENSQIEARLDEDSEHSDQDPEETEENGEETDGDEGKRDNFQNSDVESESEDSDDATKEKSTFEERQERLQRKITEHEEKALGEKPWQLKGEVTASTRPQNSLLAEVLQVDTTTRPAPVITEETTQRLEDIIRQRIKDRAWDNVERKFKPIQTPTDFRKKLILDQEKSKESLAQIYEKEYRKEVEKLNSNGNDLAENEDEPKQHKEIRALMKDLFMKLDALSNFHYTPKPVSAEPRIITNTPAIEMEEVAPLAVSSGNLLAPEEIRSRDKADIIGRTERTQTDKNRERRKKKTKQRMVQKIKEDNLKEKQKLGIQPTKKEAKDKLMKEVTKNRNVQKMNTANDFKSMKSSKAFFTQLQDQVAVKGSNSDKKAKIRKLKDSAVLNAKRLKL